MTLLRKGVLPNWLQPLENRVFNKIRTKPTLDFLASLSQPRFAGLAKKFRRRSDHSGFQTLKRPAENLNRRASIEF